MRRRAIRQMVLFEAPVQHLRREPLATWQAALYLRRLGYRVYRAGHFHLFGKPRAMKMLTTKELHQEWRARGGQPW